MNNKNIIDQQLAANFRRRAEEAVRDQALDLAELSDNDIQELIHELQIHRIELELQNEELRQTQLELENSCDKYFELYNSTPVGYFTIQTTWFIWNTRN